MAGDKDISILLKVKQRRKRNQTHKHCEQIVEIKNEIDNNMGSNCLSASTGINTKSRFIIIITYGKTIKITKKLIQRKKI